MPNRLIHLLLLAASLSASGAAIVALSNGTFSTPRHAQVAATNKPAATPAADNIDVAATLLPTIVVHPEPETPTLATVTVRPSRAELVDAAPDAGTVPLRAAFPATRKATMVSFASTGFDMPYYSFGRTLRPASKE